MYKGATKRRLNMDNEIIKNRDSIRDEKKSVMNEMDCYGLFDKQKKVCEECYVCVECFEKKECCRRFAEFKERRNNDEGTK